MFGVQSVTMKKHGLTGMYYDYAMAAPFLAGVKPAGTSAVVDVDAGGVFLNREPFRCQILDYVLGHPYRGYPRSGYNAALYEFWWYQRNGYAGGGHYPIKFVQ